MTDTATHPSAFSLDLMLHHIVQISLSVAQVRFQAPYMHGKQLGPSMSKAPRLGQSTGQLKLPPQKLLTGPTGKSLPQAHAPAALVQRKQQQQAHNPSLADLLGAGAAGQQQRHQQQQVQGQLPGGMAGVGGKRNSSAASLGRASGRSSHAKFAGLQARALNPPMLDLLDLHHCSQ